MSSTNKYHSFAEVVESSLYSFTAQSWQWDTFPEFGSLVVVETKKRTLFGVVHSITTGSMEPGRYPFTYQKTEEELLAQQPQIFEFLKTTFSCITLGFKEHDVIYQQIAPEPPKIHAFVSLAQKNDYTHFFAAHNYLPLLFKAPDVTNLDELILALTTRIKKESSFSEDKLHEFIETFSLLTGNDYRRLKLLLMRL